MLSNIDRDFWTNVTYPSDPSLFYENITGLSPLDPTANWYQFYSDTRLRMDVVGIYFYNDTTMWGKTCYESDRIILNAAAAAAHPECLTALNIHIVQNVCCLGTGAATHPQMELTSSTWNGSSGVTSCSLTDPATGIFTQANVVFYTTHWAHELGHTMQLFHTYESGPLGTEATNSQPPGYTVKEYLGDIFGRAPLDAIPQTWCTTSAFPIVCTLYPFGSCPPSLDPNDGCTNNVMGNNEIARFTSPLQMARMHRALMLSGTGRYAWGYDPVPYTIDPYSILDYDLMWTLDFQVKMYQDLHISAGSVLVVKCILEFVPQSRLVIEPGGKLIIDGGVVRAAEYATERWRGIEVWGNADQDRSIDPDWNTAFANTDLYSHQGAIEIKNGGRIENAEIGVLLGSRDAPGKGGGVFKAVPDGFGVKPVISNCAVGIEYQPYITQTGDLASTVTNVSFERNADALTGASGPYLLQHIKATSVHPLFVEACSFTNQQPELVGSFDLGQGITSFNSTLTVRPGCLYAGSQPCPDPYVERNTFSNLDHGIELFHSGAARRKVFSSITQTDFSNTICGVYANGMPGFTVTNCNFTLGNDAVALTNPIEDPAWFGYHRGIYAYNSYAFTVEGNVLGKDVNMSETPTEGIVIGYSRDHNDVVRLNEATGLDRAYVGEGICADVNSASSANRVGLQFLCNTNSLNPTNFWSRKVDGANPVEQASHTIRLIQGYGHGADNTFDLWPRNVPDRWDYQVTSTFGRVRYRNRSLINHTPLSYPTDRFGLLAPLALSAIYCLDPLAPFPAPRATDGGLKQHLLDQRTAYGNTRYLFDALLDGGSTDEVVQEITSSWPAEAWDLRNFLIGLSPFVSAEALKEAVNKPLFPLALKAEVCLANPDATQAEGFEKFLLEGAVEPFPTYLMDLVRASWNHRTYRTDLETELADRHTDMSQTANALLDHYHANGSANGPAIWVWQQIRTTAARYAEAALLLGEDRSAEARAVIEAIPLDRAMKDTEQQEQQRMLAYMALVETAQANGRDIYRLLAGEVGQLVSLRSGGNDRASNWINNLLCFVYADCVAPLTGGAVGDPKALYTEPTERVPTNPNWFRTAPNPANAWVTFSYRLAQPATSGFVLVKDATGRTAAQLALTGAEGQLVLDTRELAKGLYTVQYLDQGQLLQLDKLVLQ